MMANKLVTACVLWMGISAAGTAFGQGADDQGLRNLNACLAGPNAGSESEFMTRLNLGLERSGSGFLVLVPLCELERFVRRQQRCAVRDVGIGQRHVPDQSGVARSGIAADVAAASDPSASGAASARGAHAFRAAVLVHSMHAGTIVRGRRGPPQQVDVRLHQGQQALYAGGPESLSQDDFIPGRT